MDSDNFMDSRDTKSDHSFPYSGPVPDESSFGPSAAAAAAADFNKSDEGRVGPLITRQEDITHYVTGRTERGGHWSPGDTGGWWWASVIKA